jgi:hypothetical protein
MATDIPIVAGPPRWHELDWRFMVPTPLVGPVYLASEHARETAGLLALGVDVVGEPRDAAAAFVGPTLGDLSELERELPPGALVRVAVLGTVRLRTSIENRGWGISDELRSRGWDVLCHVWAIGGIDEPSAYVDVTDRQALIYWWRRQRPTKLPARLASTLRLALARSGSWRALCSEGFVFARTPV